MLKRRRLFEILPGDDYTGHLCSSVVNPYVVTSKREKAGSVRSWYNLLLYTKIRSKSDVLPNIECTARTPLVASTADHDLPIMHTVVTEM